MDENQPSRPKSNVLEKEWLLYQKDGTTSAIKVLAKDKIAVARAYLSSHDQFIKRRGRSIALARLHNFMDHYTKTGVTRYDSKIDILCSHISYPLFEIASPDKLDWEEEEFFKKVIQPRLVDLP